jgi:NAD+ kinase
LDRNSILGYPRPEVPACYSKIENMVPPGFDEDMAFAIVLGGDGTVLSACRQLAPAGIPILTINIGHIAVISLVWHSNSSV